MHSLFIDGFLSYLFIPLIAISVGGGIIAIRRGISISHVARTYHHPLLKSSRGLIILGAFFVGIGLCIFFTILAFRFYFLGTLIDVWTLGFILINAMVIFAFTLLTLLLSKRKF